MISQLIIILIGEQTIKIRTVLFILNQTFQTFSVIVYSRSLVGTVCIYRRFLRPCSVFSNKFSADDISIRI